MDCSGNGGFGSRASSPHLAREELRHPQHLSQSHSQGQFISRVQQIPLVNSTMRALSGVAQVYDGMKGKSGVVKVRREETS